MRSLEGATLALFFAVVACSRDPSSPPATPATPEPPPPASAPAPPSASASPTATATASASASAAASASASASAPSAPSTPDVDPIVALALPPTDAALRKAYKGPPHTGPFISAGEARVTGDATRGWTVIWSRHPPAGFTVDAVATVSPEKRVKVTKAIVTYSPN